MQTRPPCERPTRCTCYVHDTTSNYFARRDTESKGLKRPSLGPSGPRLRLRVACPTPGIVMGVAGAATPVAHPDAEPLADGVSCHADARSGDSAGGMLPFRKTLRSSSRERGNARPREGDERALDASSASRRRLRLRAATLSVSTLGLSSCQPSSSSRVSSSEAWSSSGVLSDGLAGGDLRRRRGMLSDMSRGVAGISCGLRERETEASERSRGRGTRPRVRDACSMATSMSPIAVG